MTDGTPARELLGEFLTLFDDSCVAILPHALRVAVELNLADAIASGHSGLPELAAAVGADADSLARLLRALASVDLVTEVEPRRFALTDLGQRLRGDVADSIRASLVNVDSQLAWVTAASTIRSGRPAFHEAHGDSFFAVKDADAGANRAFLRRMRTRAAGLYADAVCALDWKRSREVMDIGGGDGYLLGRLLADHTSLRGVLFDRPATIGVAAEMGLLSRFVDRSRLVAGDFFESLPAGADTHLMCSVLHDWTDDECLVILRNSRTALEPGGRLLIVEMIVPHGSGWHPSKWSDLGMMVGTGGRERTAPEFDAVLRRAGYDLRSVHDLPGSAFSVIEAC
jgi:SAM-dependent methyltransferase